MGKYSRDKGQRGERWLRDRIMDRGYLAHRGRQFRGGPDSPDVISPDLPVQWEMKYGYQRLSIRSVMDKLRSEAPDGVIPIAVWRQERETEMEALAILPLAWLLTLLTAKYDPYEDMKC